MTTSDDSDENFVQIVIVAALAILLIKFRYSDDILTKTDRERIKE